MCTWSGVSKSGFYEWRGRPASATAERRAALAATIQVIFDDSDETYGYRRVHAQLVIDGVEAGPELVRSIMIARGLVACQPRPYKVTTTPGDEADAPADLVERDFSADEPGTKFVGDITYISTWEGWVYLATVIDCYSKMVVGYAMADHMRTSLVTDALDMARRGGPVRPDCIFHSDRGSQYTSEDLRVYLKKWKMRGSMGRTGVCWDNAMAESFFASLKKELVHRTVYSTRRKAIDSIAHWIEVRYNRKRLHSGIAYQIPADVHYAFEAQTQAA
jgi:putative transposase